MRKFLYKQNNIFWLPKTIKAEVETYLSDELPTLKLCPSSYALVFKNGALLQTDLRKGERAIRSLDIPGGHIEKDETPEQSAIRETFEETGVRVKNPKLVAYKKITIYGSKPKEYKYPYPISYMLFYLCELIEETNFKGNHDTYGRVWLESGQYEKSKWYCGDKIMVDKIIKEYKI
ncbi:MAG: NUDIX domain-containing protein [Candidatus Pacebacteria bacterium]|nr:NUDIX domain-containing protein [Candidatus Paceibacterota bacterium]MCF7862574.1 NUDIX domain-containing protein [Candidatus Paceibacterota bacterium]